MSESIAAALEHAVSQFSNCEAVVDGETRWSYGELHRRVAGFDRALDRLGLGRGEVVGVLGLNSASHLVAWLAIPRSGRVLNDLNFRLAPAELEMILADSSPRALLVDKKFWELGRSLAGSCGSIESLIYMDADATPEGCLSMTEMMGDEVKPPLRPDPEAIAGIFYTGGSTGLPKGAVLSHRNLVTNAKHMLIAVQYAQRDSYLHAAPMFHLANGASTLAVTWVGARHVVVPSFDPQACFDVVEREHVTRCLFVPTMINAMVNHPAVGAADLSSLEMVCYGASPMPAELLNRAMETIPCDWVQLYGMTEAAPLVTCLSAENHRRGASGEEPYARRLRSAGCPVVGVEAEVRRSDGSVADVEEPAEICVRGPNIMQGYWNRPGETSEALDADGWYHTGDAAWADEDGFLYIVDRVKDMIISGGENVYSTEVENALYEHPAVLECAVFGIPDAHWGERVHATIVLRPDAGKVEANELIDHCRDRIAGYKVPRSLDFRSEPLPKSGAGKILKRQLRGPFWAGK